jgi:hypothetical protein
VAWFTVVADQLNLNVPLEGVQYLPGIPARRRRGSMTAANGEVRHQ